jgi:hypothetical protein
MKTVLIIIFMFVGIAALPAQTMSETMASLSYGCRAGNTSACGRLQYMCSFLTTEAEKARRNGADCERRARETSSPSSAMVFSQQASQFHERADHYFYLVGVYCR